MRPTARTLLFALLLPAAAAAQAPIRIVAPAAPGGGWDQLARVMQRVLEEEGLAPRVTVENAPGAAGTVGLARIISADRGDARTLLVTGLVMVGGVVQNRSPVSLAMTTPVARLVGEYEVLAVPADSPLQSFAQLIEAFRADPGSISWGGGSAGGTDQILVDLIARAADVDPRRANYVAFSGGGETKTALLGAQVTVAVSGVGEFADLIATGQVRALAVSAPERLLDVNAPTLKESGFDIELANWRGVVAPPGLLPAGRLALEELLGRMVSSAAWQRELARMGWEPQWLAGEAFGRFVSAEAARVETLARLKRGEGTAPARTSWLPLVAALGLGAGLLGLIRERPVFDRPDRRAMTRVALIVVGMVANIALAGWLGFVAAGTLMFTLAVIAFEARPVRAFGTGLLYCTAVYLLFARVLGVQLPGGRLWRVLGG